MGLRATHSVTWAALVLLAPTAPRAQAIRITLLGTGSPEPSVERLGPATLVEAAGERFLFDAGRGAAQRLWQLSIPLGQVDHVFLTHLHSDHIVGLPEVWLSGWLRTPFGRRNSPLLIWGPPGTAAMVSALRLAYAEDVRVRTEGGRMPDSVTAAVGHDIKEGVIHDRGGVRVIAFSVDHGTPPIPAYGYRREFAGHSVVLSGDTRPSENLIRFAEGTDVLIHEVMAAPPEAATSVMAQRLLSSHTSPEEAATVFARVKPKLAVYTHVSLLTGADNRQALLETIIPRTRTAYAGPLEIGEDLMTIVVAESVSVRRRIGATQP